ncbi:hypothetical protein LOK49_LG07G01055 [Camellia lanceoleosa]|uniref:Uncharacterized protein n=1 Tax=Camellia lanceoleosa TaxID=1840588 RepID=A0ACC0H5K9_9ERIC|nr:hypothetical protein LOK49_LG07G01055 [Camellia lanceoleosa]
MSKAKIGNKAAPPRFTSAFGCPLVETVADELTMKVGGSARGIKTPFCCGSFSTTTSRAKFHEYKPVHILTSLEIL